MQCMSLYLEVISPRWYFKPKISVAAEPSGPRLSSTVYTMSYAPKMSFNVWYRGYGHLKDMVQAKPVWICYRTGTKYHEDLSLNVKNPECSAPGTTGSLPEVQRISVTKNSTSAGRITLSLGGESTTALDLDSRDEVQTVTTSGGADDLSDHFTLTIGGHTTSSMSFAVTAIGMESRNHNIYVCNLPLFRSQLPATAAATFTPSLHLEQSHRTRLIQTLPFFYGLARAIFVHISNSRLFEILPHEL